MVSGSHIESGYPRCDGFYLTPTILSVFDFIGDASKTFIWHHILLLMRILSPAGTGKGLSTGSVTVSTEAPGAANAIRLQFFLDMWGAE